MAIIASSKVTLMLLNQVASTQKYYLLRDSLLSWPTPDPPVVNVEPPTSGGTWSTTEPAYVEGSTNTLYTVDQTKYTDGSIVYSSISKSSSYEAAKVAYNKAKAAQDTATNAVPFIVGTQTATTGTWTGVAPFASLVDGQQITYWLPYNGSGNATLNLTLSGGGTTGAISCYYSGSSRLTTHIGAGNAIRLTYQVNANVAGVSYTGWWADGQYLDGNTYDRVRYQQNILAKSAIAAGKMIAGDSTGFAQIAAGYTFDISVPILYAQTAIAAAASGTDNYTAFPAVNLQTTLAGWLGTIRKSVFLKGSLVDATFTVSPEIFTDTPIDDGSYYILLGQLYSTTSMLLYTEHPLFRFYNGQFKTLTQIGSDAMDQVDSTIIQIENVKATLTTQEDRLVILEDPVDGFPGIQKTITSLSNLLGTKNVIFRSPEAPGETPGNAGDQWWRHDADGVIIGFWLHNGQDGSAGWVLTQLSDSIFGSISADKINAGTLDASKLTISNLPVSTIVGLNNQLDSLDSNVNAVQSAINTITGVITVGDGQITITNGAFQMVLDHDSIEFKVGGTNVASIIGSKLVVKDAEIASVPTATALLGAHEMSIGGAGALEGKVTVFRSR